VLWPDFAAADLYAAIASYQQRERRFGLVGSQHPNGATARVAQPFPVDAALAGGASKITRIAI
jgi:hypothetical protein